MPPVRAAPRSWCAGIAAVALMLPLSGCGGSDDTEARIARERMEAADQARQQERIRRLEQDIAREKRRRKTGSEQPRQEVGGVSASGVECGEGVSAGSNTSCSFAKNVRDAYRASGGARSIEVYSPVTKRTYTMICTAGATTVCRGGNNASVSFR